MAVPAAHTRFLDLLPRNSAAPSEPGTTRSNHRRSGTDTCSMPYDGSDTHWVTEGSQLMPIDRNTGACTCDPTRATWTA